MATDPPIDVVSTEASRCGWCRWICATMEDAKDHALICAKSPIVARLRRLVEAAQAALDAGIAHNVIATRAQLEDAIRFAESPIQ